MSHWSEGSSFSLHRKTRRRAWFDFQFEKIPHFCFVCDRLAHVDGRCDPPVDCTTQWGEWLRESPGRSASKTKTGQKPAVSNNLSHGRSKSSYGEFGHMRHTTVCDLPTRHNLCREYTPSGVSRIGEEHRADGVVVNVGDMP